MAVSVPPDPDAQLSEKAPAPRVLLGHRSDVTDRLSRAHRGGLIPLEPKQQERAPLEVGASFDRWNNRLDLRRLFGRVISLFRARR